MRLDKYLVAFVVFGLIVSTGLLFMADVNVNYGTNLSDSDFNQGNFTEIVNEMYDKSQNIKGKALPSTVEDENFLTTLVKGAYRAVKQVKNTFSIFIIGMENISNVLGLPPIIATAAFTVLIIMVIFALIYLFMKISVS